MKNIKFVSPAEANSITHSGIFHGDDVFACALLSYILPEIKLSRIFKISDECNSEAIIFDVGNGQFDHHQPGGNGIRENGVPFSSAGLIWKHYGLDILKKAGFSNPIKAFETIDRELIQSIDAQDCGFNNLNTPTFSISTAISGFNPQWDEDSKLSNEQFLKAVDFADTIFYNLLKRELSKEKATTIIENSLENSDGTIMILDQFVPWQDFIFASNNPKSKTILFVVFPSLRGGWNFQGVPDAPGSRNQRKSVPNDWKGLQSNEFQKISGVKTATFCHPAGFIGGAETKEDVIKLARIAAEQP